MMAVSGRFTTLVNRVRFGPEPEVNMSAAELEAALLAATRAAFGDDAPAAEPAATPKVERSAPKLTKNQSVGTHLVFLLGLVVGGVLSAALAGQLSVSGGIRGELFNEFFSTKLSSALVLTGGGVLVGFGTRMAAGCTSGHGLCGMSRFQSGSMAATVAFFGTGVITSLLLRWAL